MRDAWDTPTARETVAIAGKQFVKRAVCLLLCVATVTTCKISVDSRQDQVLTSPTVHFIAHVDELELHLGEMPTPPFVL
jgi:hypothetical protein